VSSLRASVRIVLLGTGTSVGKTWVACELLKELRRRSLSAIGLKPVESGVTDVTTGDAADLARLSARPPSPPPYRLREPLSPHLAARRESRSIEAEQILTYVRSHESSSPTEPPGVVVVETAGGLFSPLDASFTNWDVACSLDPARWVLVAPDSLGVLHDVTATLAASTAREPDASTGTNAAELQRLGLIARPFSLARNDPAGISTLVDALLATRAPD